eukprot:COSAG04_NODE_618_length_11896_cov_81.925659_2_plen_87_part_00
MGCPACNPELTQKQLEFQNSGRLARKGEPIVFTIRLTSIEQVRLPETRLGCSAAAFGSRRPGSVRLRFCQPNTGGIPNGFPVPELP